MYGYILIPGRGLVEDNFPTHRIQSIFLALDTCRENPIKPPAEVRSIVLVKTVSPVKHLSHLSVLALWTQSVPPLQVHAYIHHNHTLHLVTAFSKICLNIMFGKTFEDTTSLCMYHKLIFTELLFVFVTLQLILFTFCYIQDILLHSVHNHYIFRL